MVWQIKLSVNVAVSKMITKRFWPLAFAITICSIFLGLISGYFTNWIIGFAVYLLADTALIGLLMWLAIKYETLDNNHKP